MALSIASPVLGKSERLPKKYTCRGQDVSPPLLWMNAPVQTQAFALVMEDLDAPGGIFTHWIIYNIPGESTGLPENVPREEKLPGGIQQGSNDFNHTGYGGPCPPDGRPHHYRLTLYALNQPIELEACSDKTKLLMAMDGYVLEEAQLIAIYGD